MNYIELINNFWVQHRRFHFSDKEICLFFFLLDRANELFWPERFTVACNVIRKEFSWTRNQVRWARDKLIESGIISYSGGEKGKNGQYAFTEKVLRASHAQDARNSHALSALTDDSLQTPAEREEERSESVLSEESTRNSCATHAQVTRKPRARTLYINKTIQDKTKQEDSISPDGETKTLFSNPRGEGTEDCPLRIEIFEVERETAFHSVSMDKSIEPFASETSSDHEALPSGEEKTFPVGKGEGEFSVRQDQREIVGISAIEQTEEEALGCVECNSCSKFERDVMETWEVLIGPFESHWIPLLRETLTKCYPSQVKNAIIAIDRSKHEVLMERGFEYIVQPLLNGTFGRRVKKNGRNDWHGSGSFRDPIEKFKNPAKEKPKTREELLKYTQY